MYPAILLPLLSNLVLWVALGSLPPAPVLPTPLWAGSRYTQQDRDLAVERGLRFIGSIASNPRHFARWGPDLLFCFYTVANTARNEHLRALARSLGEARARQWRRDHPEPPAGDPAGLYNFVEGAYAADKLLGGPDPRTQRRVQQAAAKFSPTDFLRFDPRREPPPADIPELCPQCNYQNARGATRCARCRSPLTFRDPYDVWLDALIVTHTGDAYGVTLGVSYPEVLRWISRMRPYPAPAASGEDHFDHVAYAITHVVYTLDDYHTYSLSPAWLPQEFRFLRDNIGEAERYQNGELLGEFIDSLRAFGEDESAPEIRAGMDYLLSHQNPDGSWGDMQDDDTYTRYHSTWTAVDALRQYSYHGQRLRLPGLRPLLQGEAATGQYPGPVSPPTARAAKN